MTADQLVTCEHCGTEGKPGDDHTCSCPFHDNDCTAHVSTAHGGVKQPK